MSNKKDFLNDFFGYIIVAITCTLYILTAVFVLTPTDKTIGQIVGEGFLAFCMGVSINRILTLQGISNAMKSDSMKATMKIYSDTVIKISPTINKLGNWCHTKNELTYKRQRIKILARAGLKYEDCFEEDGTAKELNLTCNEVPIEIDKSKFKNKFAKANELRRIKNLKQKNKESKKEYNFKIKCYWQAVNLKLSELYSNELTSENNGKKDDPNNMGKKISEYVVQSGTKDIASKIVLASALGVYGVKLIEQFSWINLIWTGFQICMFLCFGLIKMRESYMFVINEYRGRIIKKIDNLEEFDADIKKDKGEKDNGQTSI